MPYEVAGNAADGMHESGMHEGGGGRRMSPVEQFCSCMCLILIIGIGCVAYGGNKLIAATTDTRGAMLARPASTQRTAPTRVGPRLVCPGARPV